MAGRLRRIWQEAMEEELQYEGEDEESVRVGKWVRDVCMFCLYLLVCTLAVLLGNEKNMARSVNKFWVNFFSNRSSTVRDLDGLQLFMNEVIAGELMKTSFLYNRYGQQNSSYGVLFGNSLIGNASLRQVRVKSDACGSVHGALDNDGILAGTECYPSWTLGTEDAVYSKSKAQKPLQPKSFHAFTSAASTGSPSYVGSFGTYPGGGFVASFAVQDTSRILQEVAGAQWVDPKTRALFFEMFMYSANDDLFLFSQVCFEFPAGGFVLPSSTVYTYDINRYKASSMKSNLEYFFFFLSLLYILKEFAAFRRQNIWRYLHFDWPTLELTLVLLVIISAGLRVYHSYMLSKITSSSAMTVLSVQQAVRGAAVASANLDAAFGVIAFLLWTKSLRYIMLTRSTRRLMTAIYFNVRKMLSFAMIATLLIYACSLTAFMLFGANLDQFQSINRSGSTIIQSIFGNKIFAVLVHETGSGGFLYYFGTIAAIRVFVYSILVAIGIDSYRKAVQGEQTAKKPLLELIRGELARRHREYMTRGFKEEEEASGLRTINRRASSNAQRKESGAPREARWKPWGLDDKDGSNEHL